jgi:hypothetical protein
MTDLQSVVDRHSTIPDEAISDATTSIRVAQGRQRFSLDNLLPSDLARAVEMVTEVLPADALTSVLTLLCGTAACSSSAPRCHRMVAIGSPPTSTSGWWGRAA